MRGKMTMAKRQKHKTVDTLERNDCRWPIGDPRHDDFHFCGAQTLAGSPYCDLHLQMAFQPARARDAAPGVAGTVKRAA
jgi:GcrA cell cycle regulator